MKRMIKQIACLTFALATLLPMLVLANNVPSFTVWGTDGSMVSYALEDSPKVTFTETTLVVTLHGKATSYPLENLARVTYENVQGTGIGDLWSHEPQFSVYDNLLIFPSLKQGSTVAVYTLDGLLIHQEYITENGRYAFPLTDVSAGVYMLSVNGVTHKFMKR